MPTLHTDTSPAHRPLRLWPGIAAALLLVITRFVVPLVVPDASMIGFLAPVVAALAIVLWWVFFSRAPWVERLGAVALIVVALAATRPLLHESVAGAGMGLLFFLYALQGLAIALVVWAAATRGLAQRKRRASLIAAILVASLAWTLVRTGGITGEGDSDFHWRWTKTAEERLLASAGPSPIIAPPPAMPPAVEERAPAADVQRTETPERAPAADTPAVAAGTTEPSSAAAGAEAGVSTATRAAARVEWPGFRGSGRDGVIRGVRVDTDWSRRPPVEVWRRPVGPGWSSFAVRDDLIYTQEQRGDHEVVSAYRLSTGEPVWMHRDPVRFYESNGGPGPRATPTLHGRRVYTLGATGILNALDAATGALVWSRNPATEIGVTIPEWGFAGSPLVVDDVVVVALAGQLAAYAADTGERRWTGPSGGAGYSSPHLVTIDGVRQVVLLRGSRTISVAPEDGRLLWEHTWQPGASIVQPAVLEEGDVLINTADAMGGQGLRRLSVDRSADGWAVEERWTSRGLKPYFNDFVVHKGNAYGFDGSILSSIDLASGERNWKGGRYGHGQMLLLADQDLLLVLSEHGELALVSATPERFQEVTRVAALEGKTWNHPVIAGDLLLVRNGEEMAAFRLPRAR
ncbi:MAG TPA: PQQ-binding-like beta-propeller repeat protein [Vicinamibacterales bacterium]|nr:PQQ-binding-like beta-propeller repeat protein [Vicinamibacterales bacterium]